MSAPSPASLTKLMTAYVVFKALQEGRLKLTDEVTISEHAWRAEGSRTFVQVGTQIPVDILIKGMIVQSGNDATIALAERVGGTEAAFAQMMNEYARRLGMKGSNFENSDGLPAPNHYTTARDMATLARRADPRVSRSTTRCSACASSAGTTSGRSNRNALLGKDPTVDGLKTGHTDSAGYCLATSAKRNGMRLMSVVMGSPSEKAREDASAALLNYGYTFFETLRAQEPRTSTCSSRASTSRRPSSPPWACPTTCVRPSARGQAASLHTSAHLSQRAAASRRSPPGRAVGELTVDDGTGGRSSRARRWCHSPPCRRAGCGRAPSTASRCGSH